MYRILQVVSSLNINAGQMSVVMNYYRHLNRGKIQFDFLYFFEKDETFKKEIEQLGGRYYCFGSPSLLFKFQNLLNTFFTEHKNEYIAVHCHPIWAALIVGGAARKHGIKHIIAHSHSTEYSNKTVSAIRNRLLINFINFYATDYMACSVEAGTLFGEKIRKSYDIKVLNNAIDCKKYAYNEQNRENIRSEFNIPNDYVVIGNVGRMSREKNQLFLLDVFNEFHKCVPNSVLMIVGDGEKRSEIEQFINELHLNDSVILTGKRTDVPCILSAMDVFVLPSLFEGSPVSVIEAQTNGLICVLSSSITKSIQFGYCHYLSLNEDKRKWAGLIENTISMSKEINRSDYSRVKDASFDINQEASKLESYYLHLV